MDLQVLVATMYQRDFRLLKSMNLNSNAIVINQCNSCRFLDVEYKGNVIKWFSLMERGVSLSRNTALMRAEADICMFADDDMFYAEEYEEQVLEAFEKTPKADVLIFDIDLLHSTKQITNNRHIKKKHRLHLFNAMRYGACRIAVKRESIIRKNICFSLLFGGGERFAAGEDSLFIVDCLKKGLKIYAYPLIIAQVDDSRSSWYRGITEKYLEDKGALLSAAFPRLFLALFLYYAFRLKGKCDDKKKVSEVIKLFFVGRRKYLGKCHNEVKCER